MALQSERQVHLAQNGDNTGWIVGGVLLLLALSRLSPAPGNGGNGGNGGPPTPMPSIRNVGFTFAQTPERVPGGAVVVSSVGFDYQGPADEIVPWVALKPRNCPGIGCNFNDGANIIRSPVNAFAMKRGVSVTQTLSWQPFSFSGAQMGISFLVPPIDTNLLARGGHNVTIGAGDADIWVGIASRNRRDANASAEKNWGDPEVFRESNQIYGPLLAQGAIRILAPAPPSASIRNVAFTFSQHRPARGMAIAEPRFPRIAYNTNLPGTTIQVRQWRPFEGMVSEPRQWPRYGPNVSLPGTLIKVRQEGYLGQRVAI